MFKTILILIALFLSVVGLGEIMHRIWMCFLRPKGVKNFLIMPLSDGQSANKVTAQLEELRWYGKNYADCLIGVDTGMPVSEIMICKEIEENCSDFLLCNIDELSEIIKKRG